VRSRAHFEDWIEHESLPPLFAGADVFVWPAVWDEPFGMPIVEAMAVGLPVLASRTGGIPEIVDDERTGILVDSADCKALADGMSRLLSDPNLRASMGRLGRERAALFAWDRIAERVAGLYSEHAHARSSPSTVRRTTI
jgi:glycosyltransferase involved in cell wall biosynthesis